MRVRLVMLFLALFLGGTRLVAAEVVYPGKTWTAKTPAEANLERAKLDAFRDYIGGRGCVVRGGHLVYTWGDASKRADVASACKPWFTHFLLLAVEDGKLKSIDDPIRALEPRLDKLNERLGFKDQKITWRHLANQTSCYGVEEAPGEAYDYSDYNMALFYDTLFLKLHQTTLDKVTAAYLRPKLTDLLQCEDEPAFTERGRLTISPRDFARFGLLYLHKGKWNDKQLLSEKHVKLATTTPLPNSIQRTKGKAAEMIAKQRSLGGGNNQTDHFGSYSFAWWTNGVDRDDKRHWPDAPLDTFGAFGHGGIRALIVIPSLDLIVSWNDCKVNKREMENQALKLLLATVAK